MLPAGWRWLQQRLPTLSDARVASGAAATAARPAMASEDEGGMRG